MLAQQATGAQQQHGGAHATAARALPRARLLLAGWTRTKFSTCIKYYTLDARRHCVAVARASRKIKMITTFDVNNQHHSNQNSHAESPRSQLQLEWVSYDYWYEVLAVD